MKGVAKIKCVPGTFCCIYESFNARARVNDRATDINVNFHIKQGRFVRGPRQIRPLSTRRFVSFIFF